ncbi:hypothetical protein EDD18DRAFT_1111456 [Armillaria luteobubalina]|uniref:Uncharacterized protein n=1 Tax=Armillaria luteobubalina TaxID=153913 RepID=A0AA39PJR0_9AGAR|nr:hypothetical protein EDD18DRAFT_1111456 [Armillaria luteobubalina]
MLSLINLPLTALKHNVALQPFDGLYGAILDDLDMFMITPNAKTVMPHDPFALSTSIVKHRPDMPLIEVNTNKSRYSPYQKKQHIQGGASNHLQDLQHQLLPPIIELWHLALLAVDASPARFLGMGFLHGDPASRTAAEKRRIEVHKMMDGFMEELPLHTDNAVTSVFWCGKNYEGLSQEECQEILWELAEVNFHSHSSSNVQNLPVMHCFPDGNHLPGQLNIGVANYGLADPLWLHQAPYIFAMKKAMQTWEDAPPSLLSEVRTTGWTEKEFLLVEKTVVDYYCDTFWQYFGCAPVLPWQLRHQTSEDYVPEARP